MLKYTIKRLLLLIPTLIIVLTIVFCLLQMVPGSPVYALVEGEDYTPEEIWQLEEEMGFHDPITTVVYGRVKASSSWLMLTIWKQVRIPVSSAL